MLGITLKNKITEQNKGIYDNSSKEIIANLGMENKGGSDDSLKEIVTNFATEDRPSNYDVALYESILYIMKHWHIKYVDEKEKNIVAYREKPHNSHYSVGEGMTLIISKANDGNTVICLNTTERQVGVSLTFNYSFDVLYEAMLEIERDRTEKTILSISNKKK